MNSLSIKTLCHLQYISAQPSYNVYVLQAALLNSPRQRRKGQKGTPTMKGRVTYQSCLLNVMLAFIALVHYKHTLNHGLMLTSVSTNVLQNSFRQIC